MISLTRREQPNRSMKVRLPSPTGVVVLGHRAGVQSRSPTGPVVTVEKLTIRRLAQVNSFRTMQAAVLDKTSWRR